MAQILVTTNLWRASQKKHRRLPSGTMTTVATCSNPAEAMLLKSLLEANDIPAFVPDELTPQTALNYSGSGLHLQVADEHVATARRLLDEAATSGDDEDADDDKNRV
jgi:hypothetical protein